MSTPADSYEEIVQRTTKAIRRALATGMIDRMDDVVHAASDLVREAAETAGLSSAQGLRDFWDAVDAPRLLS